MSSWQRPDGIAYPNVWHTFQARDRSTDQLLTYRVQDLPPDRVEDAVTHMCNHFLRDEPICASLDLVNDPIGIEEISQIWREVAKQRCVVVCFQEGSDEIVGLNMLSVVSRGNDHKLQFKSIAVQDFVDCTLYMTAKGHLFERYKIDHFLSAWGLSVHPSYRGRGIATEILRARIPICQAFGLRLSATVFSHPGSQVPAVKVGFQEEAAVRYTYLAEKWHRIAVDVEFNKLMTLKLEG